ncbi:hypothetical protein ACHAXT_002214 [Thalassiosira profunda]
MATEVSRASLLRRRRSSRGIIAGGRPGQTATNNSGGPPASADAAHQRRPSDDETDAKNMPAGGGGAAIGGEGEGGQGPQPDGGDGGGGPAEPAAPPSITNLPPPNYAGRLAAACIGHAVQLGLATQFALCPPGKARKGLAARAKAANNKKGGLSAAEEALLQTPPIRNNNDGADDAEEYSSGDDDDYDDSSLGGGSSLVGGGGHRPLHSHSTEPHFVPTPADAAALGLQGAVPGAAAGKLPFNYRKLRFFDAVTADDRAAARGFLRGEVDRARRARSRALVDHLRNARERERARVEREAAGEGPPMDGDAEGEGGNDAIDLAAEREALASALARFPGEITPAVSAALVLESLALNRRESLEGMAKCYDGIVAAGTALLDVAGDASGGLRDGTLAGGNRPHHRLTASEVATALAPLLVTSLEESSGEALVALARLRNCCGTARYKRRFVQRIAPWLVRPPDAAPWCLRHQGDAAAIVAATELILDRAAEIFGAGWHARGQSLLRDTRRAEALRTAAQRLRRLNSPSPTLESGGVATGLFVGLASATPGSALHRRTGAFARKDNVGVGVGGGLSLSGGNDLAEWEAAAVGERARRSLADALARDWGRIGTLALSPRESEAPYGRSSSRRGAHGISSTKSKEWPSTAADGGAGDRSAAAAAPPPPSVTKSPRTTHSKLPLSPRGGTANSAAVAQLPSADALESAFGPSFSSQPVAPEDGNINAGDRPLSPPLSPARDSSALKAPKTPPPSQHPAAPADLGSDAAMGGNGQPPSPHRAPSAPLSPGSSLGGSSTGSSTLRSAGTVGSSTVPQMTPATTTREQYRALTSTAAERKRTVAACRALRAQITQFEDHFARMHGRPPKGAAERAPLASTYMQYREWKRAIRADAAGRIQALCRGAGVRMRLARGADRAAASIPLDMGGDDADAFAARARLETRATSRRPGGDADNGVEVEMVPESNVSLSPNNRRNRPSAAGPQQQQPQMRERPQQTPSSPSPKSRSRSSLPDVSVMSLAELQQRKRELKQQLKLYDMNFHAQHGRMPEKREKEPIRHLYESYNAYKNRISVIEKGEVQPGPGTAAFRGIHVAEAEVSPMAGGSPTYGGGSVSPVDGGGGTHHRKPSAAMSSTGSLSSEASEGIQTPTLDESTTGMTDGASPDLASLKAEKATLHQMLRSYEKDFFRQHKRQVSSFADIRPVASQYRRYKEIKKLIASKSSGGG